MTNLLSWVEVKDRPLIPIPGVEENDDNPNFYRVTQLGEYLNYTAEIQRCEDRYGSWYSGEIFEDGESVFIAEAVGTEEDAKSELEEYLTS